MIASRIIHMSDSDLRSWKEKEITSMKNQECSKQELGDVEKHGSYITTVVQGWIEGSFSSECFLTDSGRSC